MSEMLALQNDKIQRILIVDDQSFNIEALIIVIGICCKIDAEAICNIALSGEEAIHIVR